MVHVPAEQWGVRKNILRRKRPHQLFRSFISRCAANSPACLVAIFFRDLLVEKEWAHLEFWPHVFRDRYVDLWESEPGPIFDPLHQKCCCVWPTVVVEDFLLPAGHFTEHGEQVQSVGTVVDDVFAETRVCCLVGPYLRDSGFVAPGEHDASSSDDRAFQLLVHLFSGAEKLHTLLNCSPKQVMQVHSRDADDIFRDVDPMQRQRHKLSW